jgi:hypothetical protein
LVGGFAAWLLIAEAMTLAIRLVTSSFGLTVDESGYAYVASRWTDAAGGIYGDQFLDRPPLLVALYRGALAFADVAGVHLLATISVLALVALVGLATKYVCNDDRGAAVAMLVAAALASSPMLGAIAANGELLAAPFAAGALVCLFVTFDGGQRRWLPAFLAGICAAGASLIKQSNVDMAFAGMFVATIITVLPIGPTAHLRMRARAAIPGALLAGLALPWLLTLVWAQIWGPGISEMFDALVGFRTDAIAAIGSTSEVASTRRALQLLAVALFAGMIPLLMTSVRPAMRELAGRNKLPHALVLATSITIAATTIAAGGSFWRHYLVQLIVPLSVLAGVAMSKRSRTIGFELAVVATVIVSVVSVAISYEWNSRYPFYANELAVSQTIAHSANDSDRIFVLYGRASVVRESGLESAMPYQWTLMMRARHDAIPMLKETIGSEGAPEWIVQWHGFNSWKLDRSDELENLVRGRYEVAGSICGKTIWHRQNVPMASPFTPPQFDCIEQPHIGSFMLE